MSDIEWGAPPEPTNGMPGSVQRFVDALHERPGEWAKKPGVPLSASSSTGTYKKLFPGTEWVSRKRPDGRRDIYARWVGE